MKIIQKNTLARFSNQTYSVQSMMELMGRQPEHLPGYIRHKFQHKMGFMSITEGMGNVITEGQGVNFSTIKSLNTWQYTYDVDVAQIPQLRFTRACTSTGTLAGNYVAFDIYLNDRFYGKHDVIILANHQQLYIMNEPVRESASEYRYTVKIFDNNPSQGIDTRWTTVNQVTRYLYNAHSEFSEQGNTKNWYNIERHTNYMTKIRSDQAYSSDFAATQDMFFISDEEAKKMAAGGKFQVFKLDKVEQQVLNHFLISANNAVVFGRTTMDVTTGRSHLQLDNNQDVISGKGIIPQYEEFAQWIDFSKQISIKHFQDAIEYLCEKRNQSTGNHFTFVINRKLHRMIQNILKKELFLNNPAGMWFYTQDSVAKKDAKGREYSDNKRGFNNITVGATFESYIFAGNIINFVVDEELTRYYNTQNKAYGILIDTSMYESSTGAVPAISLVTLKGRSLIKASVTGVGGINGTTSGNVSSTGDASTFIALGWRGAVVRNPYGAVIFNELV